MQKSFLTLLLVLVVAAAYSVPVGLADDGGMGKRGKDRAEAMKAHWMEMSAAKQQRALQQGERAKMFSKCTYDSNGTVESRFLRFTYDNATGAIGNLTIRTDKNETTKFLDSAAPTPFSMTDEPFVAGASLHAFGENLTIRAHCNPTAVMAWHNGNGTRTLTIVAVSGATVNVTGREARIGVGSAHAHVLVTGNATLSASGQTLTAVLHSNEKAMFRAHPNMGQSKVLHEQNAAFLAGKLGAVVNLVDADGTAVEDAEEVDVETEAKTVGHGRVEIVARGEGIHGNRVVFLMVPGDAFDLTKKDRINVTVGGAMAAQAATAAAVASANGAAAFITDADGSIHIVVNVPHFSDQTITVAQAGTEASGGGTSSKGTPGFGLALALLGLAGVVTMSRRRSS